MALIILKHHQAVTLESSKASLLKSPRALGWVSGIHSLNFAQATTSDKDVLDQFYQVPSTVGNGMGRRVTLAGHGFVVGDFLRLHLVSGVVTFSKAYWSTDSSMLATHMVVAVQDSDTFDVAQNGAWIWGKTLTGDLYLADSSNPGGTTSTPSTSGSQRVGIGDGVDTIHLTLAGASSVSVDALVTELNQRTDLIAVPKGSAGGDLAGTYTDPVVRQLTGVGAALAPVTCDFTWPASTYGYLNGGRGICAGRVFLAGVETKAWVGQAENGELFWTTNNWKSTVADASLKATAGRRWNCIRFGWVAALNAYAWIAGDGYTRAFWCAAHVSTNYNSDGTVKSWTQINASTGPANVGDMDINGPVTCWVGADHSIGRTSDYSTFTQVASGLGVTGGIATDNYGHWLAIERDSGKLWQSVDEGLTWALLSNFYVDNVLANNLPISGGEQWGSISCAYGLWVASVWNVGAGHKAYAYSEDRISWFSFTDTHAASFYSQGFDGVRWYATNPASESDGVPPIYELLVDSIPVHRRLAMEKGGAVEGPFFFADLPNAAALGTDANGKVVAKSILTDLGVYLEGVSKGSGKNLNFKAGSNITFAIVDQGDTVDIQITAAGGSSSGGSKYASTMSPANALYKIGPPNGTSSQWAVHGTLFVPPNDIALATTTKLAMQWPQPASGASYILAIYRWVDATSPLVLVAATGVQSMPASSSWLDNLITTLNENISAGQKYYFCFFWNGNGGMCMGLSGDNLNVKPYQAIWDGNQGALTAAPATLANLPEDYRRLFGRVLAA